MYGTFPIFPPIARKPSVLLAEILPPLPRTISEIPRKMICVASVTIIGGSSWNFVRINPLTAPQMVPTPSAVITTTINGAFALHTIQLIVAERQTIAPTEISISPSTRMYAIGSIINTSINSRTNIPSQEKIIFFTGLSGTLLILLPDFPAMITSPFLSVHSYQRYAAGLRSLLLRQG